MQAIEYHFNVRILFLAYIDWNDSSSIQSECSNLKMLATSIGQLRIIGCSKEKSTVHFLIFSANRLTSTAGFLQTGSRI